MALCTLINGVTAYGFYTVHHEANHKNISGQYTSLRWIDHVLGNIAAIPLHLNFVAYAPSHLLHHAHTNVPDRDPDFFMAGPGKAIVPRWLVSTILKTILCVPVLNQLVPRVMPEPLSSVAKAFLTNRKGLLRYNQACLAVLVTASIFGQGSNFFLLWWLPAQIGALILQVWFVWLPHHDFSETSRYRNTRIRGWLGSTIMLLGQDHHLIHHLYPRVPFYRYRRVYREIHDSLVENGARIQFGFASVQS
jgi:fatty acid desaturase